MTKNKSAGAKTSVYAFIFSHVRMDIFKELKKHLFFTF